MSVPTWISATGNGRRARSAIVAIGVIAALCIPATDSGADGARTAQATAPKAPTAGDSPASSDKKGTGKSAAGAVSVRGTVSAIDKEQGTVTLKGPKGRTLTIEVRDRSKLDAVAVGDPVVAVYMEAVALQVKKAAAGAPGVTTRETRVGSKPGETPAGMIGREVSITGTITAINRTTHAVTVKGPDGGTQTIVAKDPKNLEGVKVGDLVELTYTQALAVSLDKSKAK
jgi:hypothetical protein